MDSLKRELRIAKHDTAKVRLRYVYAQKLKIRRIGYWDSLISDAYKYKAELYEGRAYSELGFILAIKNRKEQAVECMNKGIEIASKLGDKYGSLRALEVLTMHYSFQNFDAKKALDYCYKRIKIAEELEDFKNVAMAYSALADIYLRMGELKKALNLHLKSLNVFEKHHFNLQIAYGILDVGMDYWALNDTINTIRYYMKSLRYINEIKNTSLASSTYNSLVAAYGLRKIYDSASYYSTLSIQTSKLDGDKHGMAGAMCSLARIKLFMGDTKSAIKIASEALEFSKQIGFIAQIKDLALVLKDAYLKSGYLNEALKYYELYVNTKDSLTKDDYKKQALEKEFNYNLEKKESENKLLVQQNQIQTLQIGQNKVLVYGIAGIAVLILIIAYLLIRQNKIRAEQNGLRMEQRLISAQMNPHFVFNSLNSIQQLIMSKENEKAEFYLSKFAKLIRELLESNTKESLTIKEETDILQGYLIMESKRFGKSFNYSIQVDEKINQDSTNIPHMMVQPFVENAIWHGLLPKAGERNLTINYTYDTEKTICCTIEDDGVGREAANKKQSTFKKKSLALSFVKQRLELMQETLKVKCSIEIIDKKNELGEGLGTKIIIILPLLR
jgi:tetratricopeptide (TPR) repeat protein